MDKNVNSVLEKYMERATEGFKKYGCTTERKDVDLLGWLKHLQEEMMDATIYIERTMDDLVKAQLEAQRKAFAAMIKTLEK
jgi:hypothetical protein